MILPVWITVTGLVIVIAALPWLVLGAVQWAERRGHIPASRSNRGPGPTHDRSRTD